MTIRVGIIGTGSIADGCHGPAVSAVPSTMLTAVLSRSVESGERFLKNHNGSGRVHTSIESFASDENVDLVIICSPDRMHFAQALGCLRAGKHVLLEKPVTTDLEEAVELDELARNKGLVLASGFHLRSHIGHRLLWDRLRSQSEIGALRHIRAIWAFSQSDASNWRAKEQLGKWWSLAAVGTHCLDLARWFASDTGDWSTFCPVIANNIWQGPHDETAVIAAQLPNGVTVEVVSSVQFGTYHRLEIFGASGKAICESTMGREGRGVITINDDPLTFNPLSPFAVQLENVVGAILRGEHLNADFQTGILALKDLLLVSKKF